MTTEDAAWEHAHALLDQARARAAGGIASDARSESVGSKRLLEAAAAGDVHDERLFTAIAEATGARGNTTALVGTAEQVADSLHALRRPRRLDASCCADSTRSRMRATTATIIRLVRAEVARRDELAAIDR